MTRGLTAANLTALLEPNFSTETLIELYVNGVINQRYTTGLTDVTIGIINYSATNGVTLVGNLNESYILNQNQFNLQIETTDVNFVNTLEAARNNIRVVAYQMFRNLTTGVPDTANLIPLYDSNAAEITVQGGEGPLTISIQTRPVFNALDKVKSRTNSDLEPPTGTSIIWGSIQWQSQ